MRKLLMTAVGVLLVTTSVIAPARAELKVGDKAPDFALPDQNGKTVKLSDFLGKRNVVLAFYVLAFTGGWTKELKAYQADIAKFEQNGTQVIGISADSAPANKAFAQSLSLTYPILSDPDARVIKEYGIMNEKFGFANRATFVVDRNGVIQHIDKDAAAIDPSGAGQACSLLEHQKP